MLGVIVNTLAVLLGSTVGLLARKGIPEKIASAIMTAIALCTVYVGISGMLKGENALVLIVSMVLGTAAGTLLDLDGALNRLGCTIETRFHRADGRTSLAEGFVTSSLLFCIGAMTFVGCINAGLRQDYELLFTKSLLDSISSCMLSVTLGFGVLCSAGFVLVFQGAIVLLAQGTEERIAELARGFFHGFMCACGTAQHIAAIHIQMHTERFAQLPDECFIPVGFRAAQMVVKMCGFDCDAKCVPKGQQHMQHTNGICAAGDRADDSIAKPGHILRAHPCKNLIPHASIPDPRT